MRRIWSHSIATAVAAEAIGGLYGSPDVYTAGLMHDLGRLALVRGVGSAYEENLSRAFSDVAEANELERSHFGVTHCECGEMVARRWGFPGNLIACMAHHHSTPNPKSIDQLYLIQTACLLANSFGFPEVLLSDSEAQPIPPETLVTHPKFDPKELSERITDRIALWGT